MLVTRINIKILNNGRKITILCSCNTKKQFKETNSVKRSNNQSCKFRINYNLIDDFYTFINLKLHNHGPEVPESVSFSI